MGDFTYSNKNTDSNQMDAGIPFGEAKSIHLNALYDIRRKIAAIIENAGVTNSPINYDAISAEVELAVSLIPSIDQGNDCLTKMEEWETAELKRLMKIRGHTTATVDDRNDAKRAASMATLRLVQVIFDEDIGIRVRHSIGVA